MVRFAAVISLTLFSGWLWAVEVSSIVSCKADGETWLCAAYENEQLQVFRSEYYQTKVEFKGEFGQQSAVKPPATAPVNPAPVSAISSSAPKAVLPQGVYTIQLLACKALRCQQRIEDGLKTIPDSQRVELRSDNGLMQVLIVGGYPTQKKAKQVAGDLITRYNLSEKPWIRTLDSVSRQMLQP